MDLVTAGSFLLAAFLGGNSALFLGWALSALRGLSAIPILLSPIMVATGSVSLWGYGGADQWLACAAGAALIGSGLLYQEYVVGPDRAPLWRRSVFNLIVTVGVATPLGLPAIVITMAVTLLVFGEAEPAYPAAAILAMAAGGFLVWKAGKTRREDAAKRSEHVVETFE